MTTAPTSASEAPPGEDAAQTPRATVAGLGSRPAVRRATALLPALLAAAPLAVLLLVDVAHLRERSTATSDLALISIATRGATGFHQLLGPYSRFMWDHPGPLYFYWNAPFFKLAAGQTGGLAVAATAISVVLVAGMVVAMGRVGGRAAAWVTTAAVLFFLAVFTVEWLRLPWNPFVVIVPVAATAVFGACTAAGARWLLPCTILTASFAVQTDIGVVPVVAAILLVVVGPATYRTFRERRPWLGPWLATAAVTVVAWSLPIYQQLASSTWTLTGWNTATPHKAGNLTAIWEFFTAHPGHKPLHEVLNVVGPQLTLSVPGLGRGVASGTVATPLLGSWRLALFVALVAVSAAGLALGCARRSWLRATLCAAALSGCAASVYAGTRVYGPLMAYLTTYAAAVGFVLWLAAGLTLTDEARLLINRRQPAWLRRAGLARQGSATLVVVGGIVVAALLSSQASGVVPYGRAGYQPGIVAVSSQLERRLPRAHATVLLGNGGAGPWFATAALANQLEADGYTVRVNKWIGFGYGGYRVAHAPVDAVVSIFEPPPSQAPTPGAKLVMRGPFPGESAPIAIYISDAPADLTASG